MQHAGWLFAPLGGMLLLFLLQDKLVFNPVNSPASLPREAARHRIRAITLSMPDGTRLRGWWLRPKGSSPAATPAVIYFGGRSEEISWICGRGPHLAGAHVLCVNYRGYGKSQGRPTERDLLADALELYDWVSSQPGVDRKRVAVIGRSLGSGVAAYVASERPVCAAVLITPYDSIAQIARRRFPYCAAQLLLKHRFQALDFARRAHAPALIALAEFDTVTPREHALPLIEAWGGEKDVLIVKSTTHCDVQEHVVSWTAIGDFLARRFRAPACEAGPAPAARTGEYAPCRGEPIQVTPLTRAG
jgi:pimeloyl-ACP methyl ester carboxylesterase